MPATLAPSSLPMPSEWAAREAVYTVTPKLESPRRDFQPVVAVPAPVAEAYRANPAATIDLLARIGDGAPPRESMTALCYALELLDGPSAGAACVEHYRHANYDVIDADWKRTPRQHWLGKVRAKSGR